MTKAVLMELNEEKDSCSQQWISV